MSVGMGGGAEKLGKQSKAALCYWSVLKCSSISGRGRVVCSLYGHCFSPSLKDDGNKILPISDFGKRGDINMKEEKEAHKTKYAEGI